MSKTVADLIGSVFEARPEIKDMAQRGSIGWGALVMILQELGLWNAQIVEGVFYGGAIDEFPTILDKNDAVIDFEGIWKLKDGDPVRIIVLPPKEPDDDSR